ncbi:MAG: excinuclease ABC subunit C [Chitinophagales bacterium]|nr:excinuclease ABC subunit C [Chitinophagales bacterium]
MTIEDFQTIRKSLPSEPGIYKYFDDKNVIIYVGKAKNISKRVAQYFLENKQDSAKTRLLVHNIHHVEYTIVNSEHDALILENSLIKEYQPKYNIRLKDDKNFPFIVIKKEPFPRIFFTRKFIKDGSEYLGPFTSPFRANEILTLLKKLFPQRSCTLALTPKNIEAKKFKVCLEYHIGTCKGPCEGKQSLEEYENSVVQIRNILKGKLTFVMSYLKAQMEQAASELKFEEAAQWKRKMDMIQDYQSKTVIVNPYYNNILVGSVYGNEKKAVVNYLVIADGSIVATKNLEVEKKLDESESEILEFTMNYLLKDMPEIQELVVPHEIQTIHKVKQFVPQSGDKKGLLDISLKNARVHFISINQEQNFEKKKKELDVLAEMKDKLRLTETPIHIECFDNSNIQGTSPVSACVVFKNGKPSKKDYRHFNVKTVIGPNDFDTMKEVVMRRYKRMIDEGETLPQLIIIDGGKGQLGMAIDVLKDLNIADKVCVIGIAKRLEEIYYKDDPIPLYIDKKSPVLKLIQQLRDEAHRFGLNFHRLKRSNNIKYSMLEDVEGIGKHTIDILYKKYKSMNKIKEAKQEELELLIGKSRAEKLKNYLASNEGN